VPLLSLPSTAAEERLNTASHRKVSRRKSHIRIRTVVVYAFFPRRGEFCRSHQTGPSVNTAKPKSCPCPKVESFFSAVHFGGSRLCRFLYAILQAAKCSASTQPSQREHIQTQTQQKHKAHKQIDTTRATFELRANIFDIASPKLLGAFADAALIIDFRGRNRTTIIFVQCCNNSER
jgi:hypothetical protein